MEDDDAIEGLDTISIGLGDVLLDANTGVIYVPNTNQTYKLGEGIVAEEKNDSNE